jgi:hypothetical protein
MQETLTYLAGWLDQSTSSTATLTQVRSLLLPLLLLLLLAVGCSACRFLGWARRDQHVAQAATPCLD